MSQTAYWPWPPDCLTCRPWPLPRPANVSRSGTRSGTGLDRDAVAVAQPVEQHVGVRLAHAPQHELVGLGVVLEPQRRVLGDQPRPAPGDSLSSSALVLRRRSRPAAAARASPTARSAAGRPWSDRVSPVSARASLATAHDVAGDALRRPARCVLAERRGERADPLVHVVVVVARARRSAVARTRARRCPAAACRRTPGPG